MRLFPRISAVGFRVRASRAIVKARALRQKGDAAAARQTGHSAPSKFAGHSMLCPYEGLAALAGTRARRMASLREESRGSYPGFFRARRTFIAVFGGKLTFEERRRTL